MRLPVAAGVVAAAAVVGALAGAAIALGGSPRHRAEVTMLVARGSALPRSSEEAVQGARTVSALVDTDAVESRVAAELRLAEATVARSLSARPRGSSGLVVLTAERPTSDGAIRLAQQAGLVVSQLVLTRFGSAGLRASIWDPARAAGTERPSAALDALYGALAAAALAALAVAALRLPRRPPREAATETHTETGTVPAFEPETPPEAGTVPAFEAEIEGEVPLETGTVPAFEQESLEPEPGRYRVRALEQAVAAAPPERRDELDAYLSALRPQADERGLLPAGLASVVRDVFGDLL